MKINILKLIYIQVSTLILILLLLTSCSKTDSNSDIYWFRDPVGFFHTNDLKRAQEEIPFTIILPSYVPEYFEFKDMKIYGPVEKKTGDILQGIEAQISYVSGEKRVTIFEKNTGEVMNPNYKMEPKYFDIAGINVLRQKAISISTTGGEEEGFYFDWNQGNLTFSMQVFSINEDEAIKIIESMIEQ